MTISVGPVELSNDGCDKNLRPGFSILTWDQLVLHLVYDTQEKADAARDAIKAGKESIEALLAASSSIWANGKPWPK